MRCSAKLLETLGITYLFTSLELPGFLQDLLAQRVRALIRVVSKLTIPFMRVDLLKQTRDRWRVSFGDRLYVGWSKCEF